ncbi:MAG TPA: methyltransferase domain-containing protein [Jatrophihabitans sp.]
MKAEVWLPPVAGEIAGFRTKSKLVVGGSTESPTLGILDSNQHGVDLSDCPIVDARILTVLPALKRFIATAALAPYDVPARRGELKNLILTVAPNGELMLRFVLRSTESVLRIRKHLPALQDELPQLRVVTVNLLPAHAALVEGEEEIVLTEVDSLDMTLGQTTEDAVTLHLLPHSFFQTNTAIAQALYTQGRTWIDETDPSSIWDLYCGVGGFALHAAHGRKITGVEVSEEAAASARRAAAEAGIDATFIAEDATTWAKAQPGPAELVIVNPPRRGIGTELATWLEESGVERVLYSSCNADSLAADLATMPSLRPVRAQVFDMFPHTAHFETLVLLNRGR